MAISRMDLADAASPERLVIEILKHEPELTIPVPLAELCSQLDIKHIYEEHLEGFEGCLITDTDKLDGSIVVRPSMMEKRRRFTIAHELGHFLLPSHVVPEEGRFLCSMSDLRAQSATEADRRLRMEVEANRFASQLLLPAPYFRRELAKFKQPDIAAIMQLSDTFLVSREAVSRSYVNFRDELLAAVITHHGVIQRIYRKSGFPKFTAQEGYRVDPASLLHRRQHLQGQPSGVEETNASIWLEVEWGRPAPRVYEQVLLQRDGYATILIEAEVPEEPDIEAEMTSRERLKYRMLGRPDWSRR
jgi:Zn-dependent peptidase ImmA (M78 family)